MEKCSSGNGVFLGMSAMGSMILAPSLGSHASGTCQMRSGTVSVIHAHCCVDAVPQERAIYTWLSPQAAKQMLVLLKRVLSIAQYYPILSHGQKCLLKAVCMLKGFIGSTQAIAIIL